MPWRRYQRPALAETLPPVIAIDGPSASGKGTVAQKVAGVLGFHYLDSGSLYRLVGLVARRAGISLDDEVLLAGVAAGLAVSFVGEQILIDKQDVTDDIRTEESGHAASAVAVHPQVRTALLERQRAFRQAPGLVADGRDMGSVVFPDAALKVFLTATVEERAMRRYKQLKQKGIVATLDPLLQDIRERDARDSSRSAAPLRQGSDARLLDTTAMSVAEAVERVLAWYRAETGDARH